MPKRSKALRLPPSLPASMHALLRKPPLADAADQDVYHDLLVALLEDIQPRDPFELLWVQDMAHHEWEGQRLRLILSSLLRPTAAADAGSNLLPANSKENEVTFMAVGIAQVMNRQGVRPHEALEIYRKEHAEFERKSGLPIASTTVDPSSKNKPKPSEVTERMHVEAYLSHSREIEQVTLRLTSALTRQTGAVEEERVLGSS